MIRYQSPAGGFRRLPFCALSLSLVGAVALIAGCNSGSPDALNLPNLGGVAKAPVSGGAATAPVVPGSGAISTPSSPTGGTPSSPAGGTPSAPSSWSYGGAVPAIAEATTPTLPQGAVGIEVFANGDLHPASSYVLSANRNHVEGGVTDATAKFQAMLALRPTWAQGKYMYRIGHGITDGRYDYSSYTGYHFEQEWNQQGNYPYDDIRFALGDAQTLGAEQLHVINFGTGTAQEAADYVSYLDNANDPHRAQYPIASGNQDAQYFELGNEISWSEERGHSQYAPDETTYATRAKQFAEAMRAATPTPIYIGAVATTDSNWYGDGWSGGATTVKNILQTMGNDVDFLIFHGYPSWPVAVSGNLQTIMAQNTWNQQKLETEIIPAIKQYETHPVFLANTEYGTELYNDAAHAQGMFGAMYTADSIILAMNDDIRIANLFCFDHGTGADSAFFANDSASDPTPIYMFEHMLAQHWGDEIVKTTGQSIPSEQVTGASTTVTMPDLSYTAARGHDGHLYVMVLNRTDDQDVSAQLALGFTPHAVTAYTLAGPNGWDSDYSNTTTTTAQANLATPYTFKHATVTLLDVTP